MTRTFAQSIDNEKRKNKMFFRWQKIIYTGPKIIPKSMQILFRTTLCLPAAPIVFQGGPGFLKWHAISNPASNQSIDQAINQSIIQSINQTKPNKHLKVTLSTESPSEMPNFKQASSNSSPAIFRPASCCNCGSKVTYPTGISCCPCAPCTKV